MATETQSLIREPDVSEPKYVVFADYDGTDGRTHRGRYCAPTGREEAERIAEEVRASGQRNVEVVAARNDATEAP